MSGRTYEAKIFNSSGTEQTSNPVTVDSSGNITFTAPATAATGYELRVSAFDEGKFKSLEATATLEVTASRTFRVWRFQTYTSAGSTTANKSVLGRCTLVHTCQFRGTEYPSTNLTSNTSETGLTCRLGINSQAVMHLGRLRSAHLQGWWTLGNSNAANSWIQFAFSSAVTLGSITITTNRSFTDATNIKVFGSNTGSFSGEEVEVADFSGVGSGSNLQSFSQNI